MTGVERREGESRRESSAARLRVIGRPEAAMSELAQLTRTALTPRNLLTHVLEFSLLGGMVTAMVVGVMRLQ